MYIKRIAMIFSGQRRRFEHSFELPTNCEFPGGDSETLIKIVIDNVNGIDVTLDVNNVFDVLDEFRPQISLATLSPKRRYMYSISNF